MFKWLDNHSGSITAIATVALALAAFFSYQITIDLLKEQKVEEQIQFRSYVSITSASVDKSTLNSQQYPFMISFAIKNSGLTPAYNVTANIFDTVSNKITNQSIDNETITIGPSNTYYKTLFVSVDLFDSILGGSIISLRYK